MDTIGGVCVKTEFFFSRRFISVLSAAVCIIACIAASAAGMRIIAVGGVMPQTAYAPLILVDAGHGGEDGGASGPGGLLEKNINLDIAFHLRDTLRLMGYRVRMTRETDVSLHTSGTKRKRSDLEERVKAINEDDVDLCVSIHQNSFSGSGKARGTQVFYAPNGDESERAAECIQSAVRQNLQPDNSRAVKRADSAIYILNNAENPAVLVECLFISDPRDALKLSKQGERADIAFAIACGVAEYFSDINR